MIPLTDKQKEFLGFYKGYFIQNGSVPTYITLMDKFKFRSPHSVTQNIRALKSKGYLTLNNLPVLLPGDKCPYCRQVKSLTKVLTR